VRRRQTQNIRELIDEMLKSNRLDIKMYETRLMDSWKSLLGETIARYTGSMYIKNQVLYVQITSAVLRNDLLLSRENLINGLNKHAGKEVIKDIVLR
jgi:predicted nucleic acid-binding Zn ribbon protein